MIELIKQPYSLAFAKNPLVFDFKITDANGFPYGFQTARTLLVTNQVNTLNVGDQLVYRYTDALGVITEVTFTATADGVGVEALPSSLNNFVNFASYFDNIRSKIANHPAIAPHTRAYILSDAFLYVEALEESLNVSVELDASLITAPGYNANLFSAVADDSPLGLKAVCEVIFRSDLETGYRLAATIEGKPDAKGKVRFDISTIIANECNEALAQFPFPAFGFDGASVAPNKFSYYLRYRLDYQDIETPSWAITDVKEVINGGVSQERYEVNLPDGVDYFEHNFSVDNALFSYLGRSKTVRVDQPEYFQYFNVGAAFATMTIQVAKYLSDGSITLSFIDFDLQVDERETVLIPAGYTQLNINDANVLKYEVRVVAAGTDENTPVADIEYLSSKKTYYVDYKYRKEVHYLQYLNNFGVVETVAFTGELSNDLQIQRKVAEQMEELQNGVSIHTRQYNAVAQNTYTYRSGYMSQREVVALQELLISNHLFEVTTGGYDGLIISTNRFKVYETNEFLKSVEFKATPTGIMKNYSAPVATSFDNDNTIPVDTGGTGTGGELPDCGPQNWELVTAGCFETVTGEYFETL